jgi:hypothetical protein
MFFGASERVCHLQFAHSFGTRETISSTTAECARSLNHAALAKGLIGEWLDFIVT